MGNIIGYVFDATDMSRLRKICDRIYAEEPLKGDERRDLANHMDALLHHAEVLYSDELKR